MQYTTVKITEEHSTLQYNTVQHTKVHCSTVHYSTAQYNTLHYTKVQHTTVQYNTVHYTTVFPSLIARMTNTVTLLKLTSHWLRRQPRASKRTTEVQTVYTRWFMTFELYCKWLPTSLWSKKFISSWVLFPMVRKLWMFNCRKRPRVNRASPVAPREFAPAGRGAVSVSCGRQWYFKKLA